MDSIQNVINMVKKGAWMASVDLKDAYYSIPINRDHKKFFKFMWKSPFRFLAMPNGYGPAMLKFNKILNLHFRYCE